MGDASGTYADVSIITEEDYRTEDPMQIAQKIASGLTQHRQVYVDAATLSAASTHCYSIITDRQEAINAAIQIAKKGDIVVCTGKSHEQSLCRGTVETDWDEYTAVQSALKSKNKKTV